MKRTKPCLIPLLFLSLAFVPAAAQEYAESEAFQKSASDNSLLFRARQALRYNMSYDGTYYWYSPDFEVGGVMYDGRWYDDVTLNVDAFGKQLVAIPSPGRPAVELDRDHIDFFTMGETRFVNLRKKGYDVPVGFYEVAYEGPFTLYRVVNKKITSDYSGAGMTAGYAIDSFDTTESYYIEKDGSIAPVRKRKARRFLLNPSAGRDPGTSALASKKAVALSPAVSKTGPELRIPTVDIPSVPLPDPAAGDFKIGDKTVYASLPPGFFSDGKDKAVDDELLRLINAANEMVTFANKVYQIGQPENARGDHAYVNGTVRDILSGEPITGVAVFDGKTGSYTMTDNDGGFRIRLPLGDNVLGFSGYSLEDLHLNVHVDSDGGLDVVMKEKVTSLKGAVVSAESMVNHRDSRMGIERVRINTINKIPSAFGEADVIKVVLTLPGVKSVGEASSGFNVRGGSSDQNLVLFNDGTIYNPSHFFGIFSAFNTDVINDIELYKSSIPAEFGGRISSVLDVRGREGNAKKVQGSLGLGLLTSRFHIEGPIVEDRTTFIVGGRTTYSNWIFNLIPENSAYSGGKASFSDLNASVTHRVNARNTLQAYAYWSRDGFSFARDTTFRYSNINASLKWRHTISERTGFTAVTGYDRYSNIVDDSFNDVSSYSLATEVGQAFLKGGFKTVLDEKHTLSYGANAIYYDLNPGHMSPLSSVSLVDERFLPRERAVESALYVSDGWKPDEKLSVDLGLRISAFNAFAPSKFYWAPELRASAKYSFRDNLSVKAGFNSMSQYIHLISNTSSVSPMDTWRLAGASMRPQEGWQAAAGLYWTVRDNTIDLSLETYYKRISRSLDYKSGAVLIMNENLAADLVETYGKAYGVELMAKKTLGKLNGWVSYTYSRSLLKEMEDRGVETINGGAWYRAPHDKPHDFKLVGNYKFTHRYSLSVNVDYSTGRPVTIPVAVYNYGGGIRLAYSTRNGYRIPDYFRMDMALNIDPGHYLRKLTHMSFTLGVYNVTGRKNPYSVYYNTLGGTSVKGYMVSVFATQIPYLTLNLKFG